MPVSNLLGTLNKPQNVTLTISPAPGLTSLTLYCAEKRVYLYSWETFMPLWTALNKDE